MRRASSDSEPYQWLIEVIEKNRTLWFEIATQFRAIFTNDGGEASGAAAGATGGTGEASSDGTANQVLSAWIMRRIQAFVGLLRSNVPLVRDGAVLHDLLDQCMFFGASMGR